MLSDDFDKNLKKYTSNKPLTNVQLLTKEDSLFDNHIFMILTMLQNDLEMSDKENLMKILGPYIRLVITNEMIKEAADASAEIILRGFDEEYRDIDREITEATQDYDLEKDVIKPFLKKMDDAFYIAIGKRVMEILEGD